MPSNQYENIELTELETSARVSRQAWHPKLTPYRLFSILLPVFLGTMKAVALQQGKQNEPITLEWISGVVVFIVLFNTGTYECRPIEHVPGYLAWLFKYDCMDAVWWLRLVVSRQVLTRPRYISDEIQVEEHDTIYIFTSHRLLVCATVVSIGIFKAALTYSEVLTGATWIEWTLGVVVSSALYIVGLYESNTVGLWKSFFGTNRAYVVYHGLAVTFQLLGVLILFALMSLTLSLRRTSTSQYAVEYTSTQQPLIVPYTSNPQWLDMFLNAVNLAPFFLCAWALFNLFKIIRRYLGNHTCLPLCIRVFALWIASFPSYANTPPTSSRPQSFTSALTRLCATIFSLICTLRHLLYFLGASLFIGHANSFLRLPAYSVAPLDPPTAFHEIVDIFVYGNLANLSTIIPVLAGIVVLWSLGEMLKSARRVYMAREALIRRARVKAREAVQKIKRRTQKGAVRAVLRLSGLSRVDEVHYSLRELVWTLHGNGL